jgi:YegS/Rv2252/BmrU family lipid kinase
LKPTSIHFIVNPISGNGNNLITHKLVSGVFNFDEFKVKIKQTQKSKHAKELALKSIKEGADVIVACGGDGTVNEIASSLVGSNVKLGIVPMGSGNGLASALKIPKSISGALNVIKNSNSTQIDVGEINKHYFFSNTGIGFDANVINNYSKTKQRRLGSYLKASLLTFFNNPPSLSVKITTESKSLRLKPFMVFVSNSNEMGYDISLTPKASIQDGMLDAIIVEPLNKLEIIYFGFLLLIKRPQSFKKAHYFLTKNLEITNLEKGGVLAQIDGESVQIKANQINIQIKQAALSVVVP